MSIPNPSILAKQAAERRRQKQEARTPRPLRNTALRDQLIKNQRLNEWREQNMRDTP